jgi:hypothetical protein
VKYRRFAVALIVASAAMAQAACTTGGPASTSPIPMSPGYVLPSTTGPVLYVAPNGDDTNAGTAEAPLATIDGAAERAEPGTTVLVRQGSYEGDISTDVDGTEDARIAFLAESPDTRIVGGGSATGAWENDGDYVDIVGFDISGDNEDGIYNHASNVRIMQNRVYGFPTGNCIVTGNDGYTLTDINIIGNIAYGCGDNELDHGIYAAHARGTVSNNIAYGNPGFGIHSWHASNELVITNNVVFDNDEGGILVAAENDDGVPADDFLVANNIVVDNGREGIREGGDTGPNNRFVNNLLWSNDRDRIMLNSGEESGTLVMDPGFVDFQDDGSGDYRLQPTSPAVDSGVTDGAPPVAIDRTPRPVAKGVDLGVYER